MEDIRTFAETHGRRDDYEFMLLNHVLLDSIKRLAVQTAPDKDEVIKKLRDHVRAQIPDLNKCESYRNESRNRRIIMKLNYMGLEKLSIAILKIKK